MRIEQRKQLCDLATITAPRHDYKKWKTMKPFDGKLRQRHVAKMFGSSPPKLDGEILPSRFETYA